MKLAAALDAFELSVAGWVCADLGCNVGGFTDCLLQRGAARVTAVDTGYGVLAWKLRRDARVVVMERTNALRVEPPARVDLVVVDVGWTPQRLILSAARRWLRDGGIVLSLLKPHYEAAAVAPDQRARWRSHVLTVEQARRQCYDTCEAIAADDWIVRAVTTSPVVGGGGNVEFFVWLEHGGL